jgi:hypothetical protein
VGLAPTGKRRLVTAHTLLGHSASRSERLFLPRVFTEDVRGVVGFLKGVDSGLPADAFLLSGSNLNQP